MTTEIRYRILSTDEQEQNIVVRYWTDIISEKSLATELGVDGKPILNSEGFPTRCRTDYNLTLYDSNLAANTAALKDYILRCAPIQWFEMKERVANPDINTTIMSTGGITGVQTSPVPATVTNPVPLIISDRQFFQQLAIMGIISEEEALRANAAVIPAALEALISQLPEAIQFDARMKVSGATQFLRNSDLTNAIGVAFGFTPQQIDQFFIDAGNLI